MTLEDERAWMLQREQSAGLAATYHCSFTGTQSAEAMVDIKDRAIDDRPGLVGRCDAKIVADGVAWIKFLRRERPPWKLILTRQIRIRPFPGGAKLLQAFGRCFPA